MKTRRWFRKHLEISLLSALVVSAIAFASTACSCGPVPDVSTALEESQSVFAGRVVGLRLLASQNEDTSVPPGIEELEVTFVVHSVWKGDVAESTVVHTGFTCCVCGFAFEIGEEYLVYTNPSADDLSYTSVCTRTKQLDAASDDLEILGGLTPVLWSTPQSEEEEE